MLDIHKHDQFGKKKKKTDIYDTDFKAEKNRTIFG